MTCFEQTVRLAAAAYPPQVRSGDASGDPGAVDSAEIRDLGFVLQGQHHCLKTNTECYFATDSEHDTLICGVRGTESLRDLLIDLKIWPVKWWGPGRVHRGFNRQFEAAAPILKDYADRFPEHDVEIIGHSLGGAVATLLAFAFAASFPGRNVWLSTIGSPRVASRKLARRIADTPNLVVTRYYHRGDPVVWVPIFFGTYTHIHGGVHIPRCAAGITCAHTCDSYLDSAQEKEMPASGE